MDPCPTASAFPGSWLPAHAGMDRVMGRGRGLTFGLPAHAGDGPELE